MPVARARDADQLGAGAADIDGVGEQSCRRLWELGLVRSLPDLYRLTKEQLLELDGFAEISATNAIESIGASKQMPFRRVLFGLNIPDVGWVTAQNLARHFGSVDRLAAATQEEIMECEGIGPERAEAIAEWFADEDNRALVAELRALGLRFESDEDDRPAEGPLTGKQYVITGTLESMSREEARAALEALGAKVSDGVSGKTTGGVRRREPGLEGREGEKAGVPLLGEAELAALLAIRSPGLPRARSRTGPGPCAPASRRPGAVLEHGEGVPVADVPGERRRVVRCPGLRADGAASRRGLHAVLSVPLTPATGSAPQNDRVQVGSFQNASRSARACAPSAGRRARGRSRRRCARRRSGSRRRELGRTTAAPAADVPPLPPPRRAA